MLTSRTRHGSSDSIWPTMSNGFLPQISDHVPRSGASGKAMATLENIEEKVDQETEASAPRMQGSGGWWREG
jgi:hypothetical protein